MYNSIIIEIKHKLNFEYCYLFEKIIYEINVLIIKLLEFQTITNIFINMYRNDITTGY